MMFWKLFVIFGDKLGILYSKNAPNKPIFYIDFGIVNEFGKL